MATFDIQSGEYFALDEQGKINFISNICKLSIEALKELQNEIENGTNNLHD